MKPKNILGYIKASHLILEKKNHDKIKMELPKGMMIFDTLYLKDVDFDSENWRGRQRKSKTITFSIMCFLMCLIFSLLQNTFCTDYKIWTSSYVFLNYRIKNILKLRNNVLIDIKGLWWSSYDPHKNCKAISGIVWMNGQ